MQTVMLPIIINMLRAKKSDGVTLAPNLMQMFVYLANLAYHMRQGNPFSTWGENLFLFLQVIVVIALILRFTGRSYLIPVFLVGTTTLAYVQVSVLSVEQLSQVGILANVGAVQQGTNILRHPLLSWFVSQLFGMTIPILALSRGLQIYDVWRISSCG